MPVLQSTVCGAMTRFQFDLARPEDDEGLRQLLRNTEMPGRIRLQFLREPSFLAANQFMGSLHQTVICRDTHSGQIVGCGCRSIDRAVCNGNRESIGYLGLLRLLPEYRSRGLVHRGYRFLRELHGDGKARYYLTTVANGNQNAMSLLTSKRGALPIYRLAGQYETYIIPTRSRRLNRLPADSQVGTLRPEDFDPWLRFVKRSGRSKQFFPDVSLASFSRNGRFAGVSKGDVCVLRDGIGNIRGTMGLWDQREFKQTVVTGYQGWLKWARPFYNAWSAIAGGIPLPVPGSQFHFGCIVFPLVPHPGDAPRILKQVTAEARRRRMDYVVVGCHERDPGRKWMRRFAWQQYVTQLFLVAWDENALPVGGTRSAASIPYLEVGCL